MLSNDQKNNGIIPISTAALFYAPWIKSNLLTKSSGPYSLINRIQQPVK